MHDDQHGTAVISTAAMLNAVKIAGKTLDKLRVVVNGAGPRPSPAHGCSSP